VNISFYLTRVIRLDDLSQNLSIDTPENVLLDAEIAGFATRSIGALIDYIIITVIIVVAAYLFEAASRAARTSPFEETPDWWSAVFALVLLFFFAFYQLFFEILWNGQTPGKRVVSIRVVQSTGLPLTMSSAIIRNLVRLFDFLPLFYGFGLIAMFATKNTQRLGDLAAKTVVVREQRKLKLNTLQENYNVSYSYVKRTEPLPHYLRLERLDETDRRAIIDYLQRRSQLRNSESIARMLAQNIGKKMELTRQDVGGTRPDAFLEQVAYAFEIEQKYRTEEDNNLRQTTSGF
jgi:uncharacterized RDD family membrane protein YckC